MNFLYSRYMSAKISILLKLDTAKIKSGLITDEILHKDAKSPCQDSNQGCIGETVNAFPNEPFRTRTLENCFTHLL